MRFATTCKFSFANAGCDWNHFLRSCGSTVGPMLSKIGVRTVDVGNAMLSMHSIRETGGSQDVQHAIDAFNSLFEGFAKLDQSLLIN